MGVKFLKPGLKVGLIGGGTMGTAHAEAYRVIENAELDAVADLRPERAQAIATKTGATVRTASEIIADPNIDVIDVCLPTYLHRDYVVAAAEAGKHVFCEKPMARSLKEAEEMKAACEKAGVKLGIGHVVRFFPEYVRAYEKVKAGAVGDVAVVRCTRGGFPLPTAWQDWYANYELSGGLVLDMIIHDFDFLRWLLGPAERVFAKSTRGREYNRLEYALVTIKFKSGAIAHVEGSWVNGGGFHTRFEIAGSNGLIDYDSRKANPITVTVASKDGVPGVPVPASAWVENPYTTEIRNFINVLDGKEGTIVDGNEGYESLRIALAALESIETGKPVSL